MITFDVESIESNSSCVLNPSQKQNHSPDNSNGNMDTCFRCQKQGHWQRDCPAKTPPNPKKADPSTSRSRQRPVHLGLDGSQYSPCLLCPCGAGSCYLRTSNTDKNPDRLFFCCPANKNTQCGFFKWFDKVGSDEIIDVPICGCGAGPCCISTETSGPNTGRRFFICPIKKGQGACNFFKWHDAEVIATTNGSVEENMSSPESTLISFDETSPANSVLIEGDSSHQGIDIESSPVDTRRHPHNLRAVYGVSKRDKAMLVEVNGQEDTFGDPLPKHRKSLRHGAPKVDCSVLSYGTECLDMPQAKPINLLMERALPVSVLTSEAEINRRQAEFWRQISIAGTSLPASSYSCSSALPTTLAPLGQNSLVTTDFHWNLGLHFDGWWGKIAFPPSRCLTIPAPRPFFCCVFPCFDPISMPQNVDAFDARASASTPPLQVAQPLSAIFCKPSGVEVPLEIGEGDVMRGLILDAFSQTAVHLQNKLLTSLESMNFHDHESMTREACATFAVLDRLKEFIDYRPFCARVKKFISCASTLSEIDWSIRSDYSCREELVDLHNCEEKRRADISRVHAEAMDGLKASRECLQLLQEEATRVRDLLFHIETKLYCVETENRDLENRFVKISKDMADSEECLKVASRNAETAQKLCQQKEAERDAAELAFQKAKIIMLSQ